MAERDYPCAAEGRIGGEAMIQVQQGGKSKGGLLNHVGERLRIVGSRFERKKKGDSTTRRSN